MRESTSYQLIKYLFKTLISIFKMLWTNQGKFWDKIDVTLHCNYQLSSCLGLETKSLRWAYPLIIPFSIDFIPRRSLFIQHTCCGVRVKQIINTSIIWYSESHETWPLSYHACHCAHHIYTTSFLATYRYCFFHMTTT